MYTVSLIYTVLPNALGAKGLVTSLVELVPSCHFWSCALRQRLFASGRVGSVPCSSRSPDP